MSKTDIKESTVTKKGRIKRLAKFVRNIVIIFFILVVLAALAGVAYIWYVGQNTNQNTSEIIIPEKNEDLPFSKEPAQLSPNSKNSASIQMITSPIKPGSDALITVRTNRDSKCTIKVEYNKVPVSDANLMQKTADEYGMVSWDWFVGYSTPIGKWPVAVTCVWNGKAAVVIGDLVVEK